MSDIRHNQAEPFTEAEKAMPLGERIFKVMIPGLRVIDVLYQRWNNVIDDVWNEGLTQATTVENTYEGTDQLHEDELFVLESLLAETAQRHMTYAERRNMPAKILERVIGEQRARIQNRWKEVYSKALTKASPLVEVTTAIDDGGWPATFEVDRTGSNRGFSDSFSSDVAIRGRLTEVSIEGRGMLVVRAGEIATRDKTQAVATAEINYLFRSGHEGSVVPVLDIKELDPRDPGPSTQAGAAAQARAA